MKITLYLLNRKAYDCLKVLVSIDCHKELISEVVVARDSGNQEDFCDEIISLCVSNGIPFFDRKKYFTSKSNYSIAIGWRWLIKDVINLIVIHDSLLPKYRGFSPLVNMLINGEKRIGATAIWATDTMDEGAVIKQDFVDISYPIKIFEAINLMAVIYSKMISYIFNEILFNRELVAIPQDHKAATYSIWRGEEDYRIDWSKNAEKVESMINAVGYPYGGAKALVNGEFVIRILEVEVFPELDFEIDSMGKILMYKNGFPLVACGKGAILIKRAILESGDIFHFKNLRTRLL
jgi:methionyl-tRNA formyltransferase